jgi:hypothetical protein
MRTPLLTNEEGRIEIQQYSPMIIRFTLAGYQPRTINAATIKDGQVVLVRNESALRYLPTCDPHPTLFRWRAVGVLLPKGAKVKDIECSDACTARIRSGKSSLGFGFGLNWSSGFSPWLLFPERIHQVTSERELRRVGGAISLFEQRGILTNGRQFRFIGMPAVTISYHDASEKEAAYFDQILDSLCWNSEDTLWVQ